MALETPKEDVAKQDRSFNYEFSLKRFVPVMLTVLLGSGLSIGLFVRARDTAQHELQDEFEHSADNYSSVIISSVKTKLLMLESIRSFYHGSQNVECKEFSEFIKPYIGNMNGIHAFQWAPLVRQEDRGQFEDRICEKGFGQFRITECTEAGQIISAKQRDKYFPVYYVEPLEDNVLDLGYDLASNQALQKAMNLAIESGEIIASERVRLLDLLTHEFGVYIFVPVYKNNIVPDETAARRSDIEGLIVGVFHLKELVESALSNLHDQQVGIQIIDNSTEGTSLLYSHSSHNPDDHIHSSSESRPEHFSHGTQYTKKLTIGGREWEIACNPEEGFVSPDRASQPFIILAFSLVTSLLISIYFYNGIGRTIRIERLVSERTEQLSSANESLQQEMSRRQEAQEEIQSRQKQYMAIFECSMDGLIVIDTDGTIAEANPAACGMYGYVRKEIVGMPIKNLISPETQYVFEDFKKTLQESKTFTGESIDVRKDGTTFVNEVRGVPFSYDGRPHFLGITRDVTESRHAQAEMEKLLDLVSTSNNELTRSNEKLGRSNKELEDFAYIASHDLQEPLRKVIAFGDRLKTKYFDKLDETGIDYLGRMQDAAGRMSVLINDLLTYSRVTSKAKAFEDVDLEKITREVLSDMEIRIEELGATVKVSSLCGLKADKVQMRQLIQNLISNALKFHKPDEAPVVNIFCRTVPLEDNENTVSEALQIVIEDNGIGFDEQYTDRIFGMFQRLHGREEYDGTGLGLAVCQKIADRHDIAITVNSTPGKGTTFILTPEPCNILTKSTETC